MNKDKAIRAALMTAKKMKKRTGFNQGGVENMRNVGGNLYRVNPDGEWIFQSKIGPQPQESADVQSPPPAPAGGFFQPTPKQEPYFGAAMVGMAAPYLQNAYNLASTSNTMTPDRESYVPVPLQRMGHALGNYGQAALSAAGSIPYGAAGLVGDVANAVGVPRSDALTRDLGAMLDSSGIMPEGRMLASLSEPMMAQGAEMVDASQRSQYNRFVEANRPSQNMEAFKGRQLYEPTHNESALMQYNPMTPEQIAYWQSLADSDRLLQQGASAQSAADATGILRIPRVSMEGDTLGPPREPRMVTPEEMAALRPDRASNYGIPIRNDVRADQGTDLGFFKDSPGREEIWINPLSSPEDQEMAKGHEMIHADQWRSRVPSEERGVDIKDSSDYRLQSLNSLAKRISTESDPVEKSRLSDQFRNLRDLSPYELYGRNPGELYANAAVGNWMPKRLTALESLNPYLNRDKGFMNRALDAATQAALGETTPWMSYLERKGIRGYSDEGIHRGVPLDVSKAVIGMPPVAKNTGGSVGFSTGGAMELARAVMAKDRAGGQIAPSKYMPGVPRQVHAGGGKVAFQQGNHPLVPDVLYHGNALQIAKKGWTDEIDPEQTQRNMESQDFRAFKPSSHGSYGAGIYLSDSPKVASDFAEGIRSDQKEPQPFGQVLKLNVSMKQPFTDDTLRDPEWKAYIKRALTRMSIPKHYEDDIAHRDTFLKALNKGNATVRDLFLRESQHGTMVNQFGQDDIHRTIRNSGFDGIIAHRPDGTKEYVAFKPEQIKSAIGNSGKFDPTDPDMTKAEGGRIGYGDGGKSLGLYSKAAQIIRNQPQAKGNVDQLLAMVSKGKGVKPTELTNAGRPAGDTMTKEELAQHFEQALPDVQVMRKGRDAQTALNALMRQDRGNWGQEDWDRANALNREAETQPSTRYDQYRLPGGTNYREHLLHLPPQEGPLAKRKKVLQDQWQQAYENQAPKEELDRLGAEFDAMANDEGSDFKSDHWRTPNVLAHVRMDEHDNGKTLHVQEVQSDWGQEGRDKGFHDPENPFEVIHKKTKEVVSRHPDYGSMWDAYRTHPDSDNLNYGDVREEKPPQGPYVGNTQQWTDLALKHILTEAAKNGNYDRVVFSPGEANADLYGQRKPIKWANFRKFDNSEGIDALGMLSTMRPDWAKPDFKVIENEKELTKTLGKSHAEKLLSAPQVPHMSGHNIQSLQEPDMHLGGHGMVDYYKNYVHPGALKLLQQHDPSIKPESYDLPEGYKGFSLPMTDTARQSILKNGFQAFQRGGEVHKATGGTVMGYVPTAPIQIRQLAVAPIVPRQQQRAAGSFSNSLMSLMDTVKGFKNGPEPTPTAEQPFMPPIGQPATPAAEQPVTPSASTEGHTTSAPSEGNAPEQPSYDTTGMSDAAMSAYGKLTDSWGQPISVVSGYRDADKNQAVGGAKASQHLHGNAYDIDTSGYSYEDRLRLADAAKAAGFSGFGFYGNNMHLDVGPTRAWGPSYHSDSIPDWARAWVNTNIYAAPPRAMGGSVNKALALTRGFTKDGKSAIGFLKPKGK